MAEIDSELSAELVEAMRGGNAQALADVFSHFRERLRRIARFRIDYRVAGRFSDSDVLQETFIAAAKRLPYFQRESEMSPFLWLRLLLGQQLIDMHRQHLNAEMRDARKEVALDSGPSPHTSVAIAARLVGQMTGVSEIVRRGEAIERLERVLNGMEAMDREVIALRHFEELSNLETANVLQISPAAASKRYVRALEKLAELMSDFAGSWKK